jgi:hypothetical protein
MISSTSSSDRTLPPDLAPARAPVAAKPLPPAGDQVSTERAKFLATELDRQPAIRPEMVQRGMALAADPSYPSASILKKIATQIVASPDLSEDQS